MMKRAEVNFKIALQSQNAKKCKLTAPLIHSVRVCLERGGFTEVDSSHFSLQICGFCRLRAVWRFLRVPSTDQQRAVEDHTWKQSGSDPVPFQTSRCRPLSL